ncbi:MAG: DNA cytosine methyltransferase [Acidimicrobiia bacterium]
MLTVGSLFSGIGGLDLGLERAGMEVRWQVENDEFCNRILARHWPHIPRYGDVRELSGSTLEAVDLICGGFPCQPVSTTGRRQAQADLRWLWPEFARLVDEIRPRYVLVENVPGLWTTGNAGSEVVSDLATLGYDCRWDRLFAASVGAPHLRERVFIVAYASEPGRQQESRSSYGDEGEDARRAEKDAHQLAGGGEGSRERVVADSNPAGWDGGPRPSWARGWGQSAYRRYRRYWRSDPAEGPEPVMGRVAYGVPNRLDRLRTLGNAVVPQVAEVIGRWILEVEREGGRQADRIAHRPLTDSPLGTG